VGIGGGGGGGGGRIKRLELLEDIEDETANLLAVGVCGELCVMWWG
jgi:hypothetical protein